MKKINVVFFTQTHDLHLTRVALCRNEAASLVGFSGYHTREEMGNKVREREKKREKKEKNIEKEKEKEKKKKKEKEKENKRKNKEEMKRFFKRKRETKNLSELKIKTRTNISFR